MDYDELLKAAYEKLPKRSEEKERLVIPEPQIQPDGLRTIIVNFGEIAAAMGRDEKHFFKFLVKELATSGEFKGKSLVVIGKFNKFVVQNKIDLYMKKFVTCPECNRPDTKIEKSDRFTFLKCDACGARSSLGE